MEGWNFWKHSLYHHTCVVSQKIYPLGFLAIFPQRLTILNRILGPIICSYLRKITKFYLVI